MEIHDRIEQALDQIRPALRMDGGDVEFLDYDAETKVVRLRMVGACGGCPMSTMTLRMGIERAIRHNIPEIKAVEAV